MEPCLPDAKPVFCPVRSGFIICCLAVRTKRLAIESFRWLSRNHQPIGSITIQNIENGSAPWQTHIRTHTEMQTEEYMEWNETWKLLRTIDHKLCLSADLANSVVCIAYINSFISWNHIFDDQAFVVVFNNGSAFETKRESGKEWVKAKHVKIRISINYTIRCKRKHRKQQHQRQAYPPVIDIWLIYTHTHNRKEETGDIYVNFTFRPACCHHLCAIIFVALDRRLPNSRIAPFDRRGPLGPMAPCWKMA